LTPLAAYGRFVSGKQASIACIAASIIVAAGLSAGIVLQTQANDASEIFTPRESQARVDNALAERLYPSNSTGDATFILRLPATAGNVWTPQAVRTLERVWNSSLAVTARVDGVAVRLSDICVPGPHSGCARTFAADCLVPGDVSSFMAAGPGTKPPSPAMSSGPVAVPLVSDASRVCIDPRTRGVKFVPFSTGTAVTVAPRASPQSAPYPWAASELRATQTLSISFRYRVSEDKISTAVPGKSERLVAEAFDLAWLAEAERQQARAQADGWTASYIAWSSTELALAESTGGSITLVIVAIVLLVNFAIASGASRDCSSSRHAVAVAGVASVALAIPASFGLMALAGVPYVATIGTTPFLVLGVGVDSVFVIVAAFNRRSAHSVSEPVAERVAHSLYDAGPAITLTTLTDVLAFVIGGVSSPFRAVAFFCLYTGTSLALAFVFILTIFVPLLAADGRREVAGRSALTCRHPANAGPSKPAAAKDAGAAAASAPHADLASISATRGSPSSPHRPDDVASPDASVAPKAGTASSVATEDEVEEYQGRACDLWFGGRLAPAVTSTPGIIIVLVVWLGLLATGGYLWTTLEEGLALSELAVDGHHLKRYDDWSTEFYSLGFPYELITQSGSPIDLADGPIREALRRLPLEVDRRSSSVTSSDQSFFGSLATELGADSNRTVSAARIDAVLQTMLSRPSVQAQFGTSVLWTRVPTGAAREDLPLESGFALALSALNDGDRVFVRSSRLGLRTKPMPGSVERAKSMVQTRRAADEAVRALRPAGSDLSVVVQFESFIFFEADVLLAPSTYASLGFGAAAIALVTLVLLPHVAAVVVVVIAVASIDVMLLGSMPLVGLKLNTVSGERWRTSTAPRSSAAASRHELAGSCLIDFHPESLNYVLPALSPSLRRNQSSVVHRPERGRRRAHHPCLPPRRRPAALRARDDRQPPPHDRHLPSMLLRHGGRRGPPPPCRGSCPHHGTPRVPGHRVLDARPHCARLQPLQHLPHILRHPLHDRRPLAAPCRHCGARPFGRRGASDRSPRARPGRRPRAGHDGRQQGGRASQSGSRRAQGSCREPLSRGFVREDSPSTLPGGVSPEPWTTLSKIDGVLQSALEGTCSAVGLERASSKRTSPP